MARPWRDGRTEPIAVALDRMLEQIEDGLVRGPKVVRVDDPAPVASGVPALDRLLGGGLRPGCVTLVRAGLEAQVSSLLYSVVRRCRRSCLLDGVDSLALTRWLLAGAARVPEVNIADGWLTDNEWQSIISHISDLSDRALHLSTFGSVSSVMSAAAELSVELVVVDEVDHLGPLPDVIEQLCADVVDSGLAVLVGTTSEGPLQPPPIGVLEEIVMVSSEFGGRSTLFRGDALEMVAIESVAVAPLHGDVR